MADIHVLGEIRHFLNQTTVTTLELTFSSLEIHSVFNDRLLHELTKPNGKIRIYYQKQPESAQMEVLDNLVFQFSFGFILPNTATVYQSNMLHLPRPLMDGKLLLDAEQLLLEFMIHTPNKEHKILVKHRYTHIVEISKALPHP
ncbi:hypothetical protein GO009_04285 [Muricauda sp. TY007]|uniref:hypothetical protein n=1 Tax=Allomuricauda sp. TY007 TaxID=2683200 RepID=UPI0013C279ED|nr:hypothetical protein [Muricauda sp. TY007]NDV15234.1 hypothetical protein [Muricauda sp. TY007]